MLKPNEKMNFDEFVKNFTPLYKDAELEKRFKERVDKTAQNLLKFQRRKSHNETQTLIGFLRADREFLNIMLSLVNLSSEKFKRILSAERFAQGDYGVEWNLAKVLKNIKEDDNYAKRIAELFLEGRQNKTLAKQVADFDLAQIELPEQWEKLIRDEKFIKNRILYKLRGEYSDAKGKAVEGVVLAKLKGLQEKYGLTFEHGQVKQVQKEVDYSIPSCSDPFVMIMISYMETTSSTQTTRANEQNSMYQKVEGLNVRYPKEEIALVNVIDGAGWLARRSDLIKMHRGCHYPLTLKMLDQLEPICLRYVPKRFLKRK